MHMKMDDDALPTRSHVLATPGCVGQQCACLGCMEFERNVGIVQQLLTATRRAST